jgi:hypothetical protein
VNLDETVSWSAANSFVLSLFWVYCQGCQETVMESL